MSEHELWNELGNLYFMSGAYDQAVNAYHRSIQLDNSYGKSFSNLALTYVQQGNYEEAVELYRMSIELLSDNKERAISWNRLGNVYRYLRNYDQAVIAFHRADELDPEGSDDHEKSAKVLYSSFEKSTEGEGLLRDQMIPLPQDELERPASADLDEVQVPPSAEVDTNSWTSTEPAQYEQQMVADTPEVLPAVLWEDANIDEDSLPESVQEQAIEFDPLDPIAQDLTDWTSAPEPVVPAESQQQEPAEASEDGVLRQDEDYYPVRYQDVEYVSFQIPARGDDTNAGDYSMKETQQTEVDVEERPSTAFVLVDEPEVMAIQEEQPAEVDDEEARRLEIQIAKFKRVVQINPRNAYAWINLGSLYKTARLYQEAILAYQQAVSIDPSKASYHYHLGLMYSIEGREEDAILALQQALELDPDHSLAHATLGGYYRKMGLEELARNHIGKAMKNIYNSESEYNRACLEAICGNVDHAIDLLRVALENKQTYVDWILRDPDLDSVRDDMRFKQLISDFTR